MSAEKLFTERKRSSKVIIVSLLALVIVVLSIFLVLTFRKRNDLLGDDYFKNSMLVFASDNKLPISSDINVFKIKTENGATKKELMTVIKDLYDFRSENERQELEYYENDEIAWKKEVLTIRSLLEIYEIDYDQVACDSYNGPMIETMTGFYLGNYMPKELIDTQLSHIMLSPNYFLYYILPYNRNAMLDLKCRKIKNTNSGNNPVKCELIGSQKSKVEYYFEDLYNYTMHPKTISVFKRESENENWTHYREIVYNRFEVKTDEKTVVENKLPIGFGCKRPIDADYQTLLPPFRATDFYFDYDFMFTYTDDKTKNPVTKKHPASMYCALTQHQLGYHKKPEVFVHHGFNEETNKKMITFYDRHAKTFKDYYPDDDQCLQRSDSKDLNWFYWHDLFVRDHYLFDFGSRPASYLGDYMVEGKESMLYEQFFSDFTAVMKDKNNSVFEAGHGKNLNGISSNQMFAIYYFDLPSQNRFTSTWPLRMPFRMEFRLKAENMKTEVGRLVLNVKEYFSGNLDYDNVFDLPKSCIDRSTGYNLITVTYFDSKDILKRYENIEHLSKYYFRSLITNFISPLRTNEFNIRILDDEAEDKASIVIDFRLYDPLDPENYFVITEGQGVECLQDTRTIEKTNAKQCARSCVENKDCGVYAFDSSESICKMCKMKNFNDLYGKYEKNLDFSKYIKTIEMGESKLGKRPFYFYPSKHSSNDDLFIEIQNRGKGTSLDLVFQNRSSKDTFRFKSVDSKRIKN